MTVFGIPTQPTINDFVGAPGALKFTQWLEGVFKPVGYNGTPDLATDPMGTLQYLYNRRQTILDSANQKPLVRIADKNLEIKATISEEMSCTVEELMADSGKATCVLRFDNWLTDWIVNKNSIYEDLHLLVDPIPTKPDWRTRWGGKITEVNIKNNPDGTATVELQAISMREHCKRLLFAANPIFPPEVQLPRMWVLPGPTRSILFLSMFVNLARIFVPGLSFITNAFNPAAWINPLNPDALLNVNPLSWPLQVAFVNPATDQSRWSALGATWTDWHSSMGEMLSDSGTVCRAYTWLTTDADSPHTELTSLISGVEGIGVDLLNLVGLGSVSDLVGLVGNDVESLSRPTRNAVIFSLEDDSGITGPVGALGGPLTGLLSLIGVTGDDLITSTLFDTNTGQTLQGEPIIDAQQPVTPVLQSLLGVAPAPPKVIWRDGQFTGMIKREVTMHKAPVLTVMTGGRSPAIVNEALDVETPIPTPNGWVKMGDLKDGDAIFGADGEPATVVSAKPIQYGRDCYTITFPDGESITASDGHLWRARRPRENGDRLFTTREMFEAGGRMMIPRPQPRRTEAVELPVDPYLLGYWLGDGTTGDCHITVGAQDIDELERQLSERGIETHRLKSTMRSPRISFTGAAGWGASDRPRIAKEFRKLACYTDKHIPGEYLSAGTAQRLELLKGLMDSDGHTTGRLNIFVGRKRLSQNVMELLRSLGETPSLAFVPDSRSRDGGYYRVTFTAHWNIPFAFKRKAERVGLSARTWMSVNIAPTNSVPVRCIAVDSKDRLFQAGIGGYVTHNTQTFLIKYGLSQLSDVINQGIIDNFGFPLQVPGTPGLDSLYQGQLDNVLLAWERYTDPIRALWSGDLQFQEYFDRGSSTAYTMAGWLTLREANFKTRPFYGFHTDAINGRPWLIDVDVRLGQRAGFEIGGVIYVDQITAIKRTYDRKTPVVVSMSVGDDRDKHDPIAAAIRAMQSMWMTLGAVMGEGTLFG